MGLESVSDVKFVATDHSFLILFSKITRIPSIKPKNMLDYIEWTENISSKYNKKNLFICSADVINHKKYVPQILVVSDSNKNNVENVWNVGNLSNRVNLTHCRH